MEDERKQQVLNYASGLRKLADFLEDPNYEWFVDVAWLPSLSIDYYTYSADIFSNACAKFGSGVKGSEYGYLSLTKEFSDTVKASVNVAKASTCVKVETGEVNTVKRIPDNKRDDYDKMVAELRASFEEDVEEPVVEWECPESFIAGKKVNS